MSNETAARRDPNKFPSTKAARRLRTLQAMGQRRGGWLVRPRLTEEQILEWADSHRAATGRWPTPPKSAWRKADEKWRTTMKSKTSPPTDGAALWQRVIQFKGELSPAAARALLRFGFSDHDHARMEEESAKKRDEIAAHMDEDTLAGAQRAVQNFAIEPQPSDATSVAEPAGVQALVLDLPADLLVGDTGEVLGPGAVDALQQVGREVDACRPAGYYIPGNVRKTSWSRRLPSRARQRSRRRSASILDCGQATGSNSSSIRMAAWCCYPNFRPRPCGPWRRPPIAWDRSFSATWRTVPPKWD